jgi:hypothetical protein
VAERFTDLSAELHRLRDGFAFAAHESDAPSQPDLFLQRSRDFH